MLPFEVRSPPTDANLARVRCGAPSSAAPFSGILPHKEPPSSVGRLFGKRTSPRYAMLDRFGAGSTELTRLFMVRRESHSMSLARTRSYS